MKRKLFTSIVVLISLLAYFNGRAFARGIQKGDDRSGNILQQSTQLLGRGESQPNDDRGSQGQGRDDQPGDDNGGAGQGSDDLPGDDNGGLGHGADDLPGDDNGAQSRGADDLPGDDNGGLGHGADDLPGDDNGGRMQLTSSSNLSTTVPSLHDDHGSRGPWTDDQLGREDARQGRGTDNPASDDQGASAQVSSTSTPASTQAQPLDDHGKGKHGGDDPKGHR